MLLFSRTSFGAIAAIGVTYILTQRQMPILSLILSIFCVAAVAAIAIRWSHPGTIHALELPIVPPAQRSGELEERTQITRSVESLIPLIQVQDVRWRSRCKQHEFLHDWSAAIYNTYQDRVEKALVAAAFQRLQEHLPPSKMFLFLASPEVLRHNGKLLDAAIPAWKHDLAVLNELDNHLTAYTCNEFAMTQPQVQKQTAVLKAVMIEDLGWLKHFNRAV